MPFIAFFIALAVFAPAGAFAENNAPRAEAVQDGVIQKSDAAEASALPQSWPGIKSAENVHADCPPNPTVMTIQFEGVDYCDVDRKKCGLENGTPSALFGTYVSCKESDKLAMAIESFVPCDAIEKQDVKSFGNASVRDGALAQCNPLISGKSDFGLGAN